MSARSTKIKGGSSRGKSVSHVYRALWRVLHDEGRQGNARELAEHARILQALADRELEAMCASGLVVCEMVGNRLVYRAMPPDGGVR